MKFFESARLYHDMTKYKPESVEPAYRDIPFGSKLDVYKEFESTVRISLPRIEQAQSKSIEEAVKKASGFALYRRLKSDKILLRKLAEILYHTNGITARKEYNGQSIELRASPSASAFYPTELYLYAHNIEDCPQGLYYFHPNNFELIQIRKGDFQQDIAGAGFGLKCFKESPLIIFFTSVFSRNMWKFKERSYRYSLLDAGYVGENLILACAAEGLAVNFVGDFIDDDMNKLLDLKSISERVIMCAAAGYDGGKLDEDKYTFSMMNEAHIKFDPEENPVEFIHKQSNHFHADDAEVKVNVRLPFSKKLNNKIERGLIKNLNPVEMIVKEKIYPIIERRRSRHNFKMVFVKMEELSTILYYLDYVPSLYNYHAVHTYMAVNAVNGLDKGLYYYHPGVHKIELLKNADVRGDLAYLTLNQDPVFNASVSFFFAVDFEEINLFSNRGYRYACFNVGMYSESVYLIAEALGLGARGIGNFFDEKMNEFFMLNKESEHMLGGVIVGKE